MTHRCKQCNKFVKKYQFFCNKKCSDKFINRSNIDIQSIQNSYSPNTPDHFKKIVRSQQSKKILNNIKEHKQYFDAVEEIVKQFPKKKFIFGMDEEDIEQEIRCKCTEIYHNKKYPPKKLWFKNKYLIKFLYNVIHNHLFNSIRGLIYPNNPPCIRCPANDIKRGLCKAVGGAKQCVKNRWYYHKLKVKRQLMTPKKFHESQIKAAAFIGEI